MFEVFRIKSMNSFGLHPAHYLSLPGYSWHKMLKFTDVWLKLISDTKKYHFIENIKTERYFDGF